MARVQFNFLQGFQLQKHCFKTFLQVKGSKSYNTMKQRFLERKYQVR